MITSSYSIPMVRKLTQARSYPVAMAYMRMWRDGCDHPPFGDFGPINILTLYYTFCSLY